jgi:hypothetical protein
MDFVQFLVAAYKKKLHSFHGNFWINIYNKKKKNIIHVKIKKLYSFPRKSWLFSNIYILFWLFACKPLFYTIKCTQPNLSSWRQILRWQWKRFHKNIFFLFLLHTLTKTKITWVFQTFLFSSMVFVFSIEKHESEKKYNYFKFAIYFAI